MSTARELLLSTLEEKRPLVLLLGQDAWCDSEHEDTVLAAALANLGRAGDSRPGWVGILPMTEDRYQWLAERFERRGPFPVCGDSERVAMERGVHFVRRPDANEGIFRARTTAGTYSDRG